MRNNLGAMSGAETALSQPLAALYFVLVGVSLFLYWYVLDPRYESTETQYDWNYVLAFSGILLALAAALPMAAALAEQRLAGRLSLAAAAVALSSGSNILEDGVGLEWAFFAFVLGLMALLPTLVVMSATILFRCRSAQRWLAIPPAGTMIGVLFFVEVGGPIMLATWLLTAILSLMTRSHESVHRPYSLQ